MKTICSLQSLMWYCLDTVLKCTLYTVGDMLFNLMNLVIADWINFQKKKIITSCCDKYAFNFI